MCVCLGVGEAAVAVGVFGYLTNKYRSWRKKRLAIVKQPMVE